jgi:ABC-2 type transport system permease protein
MIPLIHGELIALRTLRSTYVVPAVVLVLTGVIAAAGVSDAVDQGLSAASDVREPVMAGAGIMTTVALAIFAAMRVAGEYRHDTITHRVLASPRRTRYLTAELLLYGVVGLIVTAVALAVGVTIAQSQLADTDLSLDLSLGLVLATLLTAVLFAMVGVLVGVISRSQPVAIAILIGTFFAEKVLGIFIGDGVAYLPYGLLNPLLGLNGATISRGAAAVTLTGITVALAAVAYFVVARRDIN